MYKDTLLLIDGKWRPAQSGRTIDVVNPATEEVIGTVAHAGTADLDEALDGHPRIGERSTNASSAREQRNVTGADPAVLEELRLANKEYEQRFGHVYLVHADGRPAAELLRILRQRLHNDADTERRVLRMELAKINRSRLQRMLTPAIEFVDD